MNAPGDLHIFRKDSSPVRAEFEQGIDRAEPNDPGQQGHKPQDLESQSPTAGDEPSPTQDQ